MELEVRRQEFLGGVHEVTPEEMAAIVGAGGKHIIEKPLGGGPAEQDPQESGHADILQVEGDRMIFNPQGPDPLNLRGFEISLPSPEKADKLGFAFGGQPVLYEEGAPLPVIGFEIPGGPRYNVLEEMGLEVNRLADGSLIPRLPQQLRSAPPTNRPPRLITEPRKAVYPSGIEIEELPPQAATTAAYVTANNNQYRNDQYQTTGATLSMMSPQSPAAQAQVFGSHHRVPEIAQIPLQDASPLRKPPGHTVSRRRTDPTTPEYVGAGVDPMERQIVYTHAKAPQPAAATHTRRAVSPNTQNRRVRNAKQAMSGRNPMCGADFMKYTALASQALEQTQGWLKAMGAPPSAAAAQQQTSVSSPTQQNRSIEEDAAAKALRRKERRLRRERRAAAAAAAAQHHEMIAAEHQQRATAGAGMIATEHRATAGAELRFMQQRNQQRAEMQRLPSDEAVQKMISIRPHPQQQQQQQPMLHNLTPQQMAQIQHISPRVAQNYRQSQMTSLDRGVPMEPPMSARGIPPGPTTPRLPKAYDFALPIDRSALPEILQQACEAPGTIQMRQPVAMSPEQAEAVGNSITAIPTMLERPKVLHPQLAQGLSMAEIEKAKMEAIAEGRVPLRGQVGVMTATDQIKFAATVKDGETEARERLEEAQRGRRVAPREQPAAAAAAAGLASPHQYRRDNQPSETQPSSSQQPDGSEGKTLSLSGGASGHVHRHVTASAEAARSPPRVVDVDAVRARSTSPGRPTARERVFEIATSSGTRTIELVTLNEGPKVELFRNFLTEEECERFVALIDQVEATPDNPNNLLLDDNMDPKSKLYIAKISRRIAALTGLDIEDFAGVCPSVVKMTAMDATKDFGNIIRIYLDVEQEEGQSDFPFLGISVCPRRGAAIRWQTKNERGFKSARATHSESVGKGQQRRLLTIYVR